MSMSMPFTTYFSSTLLITLRYRAMGRLFNSCSTHSDQASKVASRSWSTLSKDCSFHATYPWRNSSSI
ncbi:hypothetical protein F0562_028895 [Nyssa sinensis]|uniref:Uncharacterized protein n=1 Tax=Nyssa sinensis TaxID=561372 RepID=A0A5J5B3N4_9ASTE|nr:hypothetical protein F0562_028895 [Nyssa sinensis]